MAIAADQIKERFTNLVESGVNLAAARALEELVLNGADRDLVRVNAMRFASDRGLNEDDVIEAFLRASRVGLFDMSWNVTCGGCGGILGENASLRTVTNGDYHCSLCSASYCATLDERVEVSFTLSASIRDLPGHHPDRVDGADYLRHFYFSTAVIIPPEEEYQRILSDTIIEQEQLLPHERVVLSLTVQAETTLVMDPVTHDVTRFEISGEPTKTRQEVSIVLTETGSLPRTASLRPGPVRLTLENKTGMRLLPAVQRMNQDFVRLMLSRQPYLSAKRVLSSTAFRELFRTDEALKIDQRLRLTNLTVLFTDLKGSTELYERVGDLTAFDLVRDHFKVLGDAVRNNGGAVVKTIGDAVMATFSSPERGFAAALEMRESMRAFNATQHRDDLIVKIGLHEGACLAVVLNDRLDYFGQTVNVAARVQGLAAEQSIFTTQPVIESPAVVALMGSKGLNATPRRAALKGIKDELTVYEIP